MRQLSLGLGITLGILLSMSGCKPKYPKCDSDDHCADGEVCYNQECQECSDSSRCIEKYGAGYECADGRCQVASGCQTNSDCAGQVCRSGQCVDECTTGSECGSGQCESGRCIGDCEADIDCGAGQSCQNGVCTGSGLSTTGDTTGACEIGSDGSIISMTPIAFDFNEYTLTGEAQGVLERTAACLQRTSGSAVVIEGHCDERGTQEYNLALGEKRANTVKSYLRNLGVDASRMLTRTKGENEPVCYDATEPCFARNRRVEFVRE